MTENNQTELEITFSKVVAALLDTDTPFKPQFLYRFSDLAGDELALFHQAWPNIPAWRRQALLEDLAQMFAGDNLLSFEAICRFAMKDPDPKVRFTALHSLQEYQVQDLIPAFFAILEDEHDEELRALAAALLGKYVYYGELEKISAVQLGEIENRLLAIANGQDTHQVRRRAIESLGFSSHKEVPALIQMAFDTRDDDWMTSALFAMGRSCDNRWDQTVVKMLDHSSPKIRREAARAAGELEIALAKSQLIELLEDVDPEVRLASVWSLSQIGGSGIQQILEEMLEEAEFDQETQLIEDALDNLIFNQSIGLHDLFDFDEDPYYDENYDYGEEDEDYEGG